MGGGPTYSLTDAAIELVPLLAELGWWGLRHRPTTRPLRVRAQLLYDGGPPMWDDFMAELRERHLGITRPDTGRASVSERLAAAYADAVGQSTSEDDRIDAAVGGGA